MEAQNIKARLLWHIVQESHQFHPPQTNSLLADGWVLDQGNYKISSIVSFDAALEFACQTYARC